MQQQSRERKSKIQKARNVVGVLAVGGKADLPGRNRLRRAEVHSVSSGQHPRSRH